MTKGIYIPAAPLDAENYQIYPVEGINVYIEKSLRFTETNPRILLRNMVFFKEIYITGVQAAE